jgi:hypothetical protein
VSHWFTLASKKRSTLLLGSLVLVWAMGTAVAAEELFSRSPERGGIGLELQLRPPPIRHNLQPPRRDLEKLDERLSLIVTDKASTSAIKFSEVMQKLADDLKVDRLTLFQRWWDTANDRRNKATDVSDDVLCDSQGEPSGGGLSTKNGFPYRCPRAEGNQARQDPFDKEDNPSDPKWNDAYSAIAFINRFDLADGTGQYCGEFRIAFARNSGFVNPTDRNLIIFEALVPNPDPPPELSEDKLENLNGCRPIVEFWLSLSDPNMSTADRGKALHDFFLKGLKKDAIGKNLPKNDIPPVVDANNYRGLSDSSHGGRDSGQIRTNQFMESNDWTLREFKISGTDIVPATVKSNPGNQLFASSDQRSIDFANYLVNQDALNNLRGIRDCLADERSVDNFAFVPTKNYTKNYLDHFNSFESDDRESVTGNILELFHGSEVVGKKMDAALETENSMLTTDNIVRRIRTQTCAGCHHYSNGDMRLGVYLDPSEFPNGWPSTLGIPSRHLKCDRETDGELPDECKGFTHVTERESEIGEDAKLAVLPSTRSLESLRAHRIQRTSHLSFMGPDGLGPDKKGTRYKISETLKLILLPPRLETMVLYLNNFNEPH